jgi:hypothetical protein
MDCATHDVPLREYLSVDDRVFENQIFYLKHNSRWHLEWQEGQLEQAEEYYRTRGHPYWNYDDEYQSTNFLLYQIVMSSS